VRKSPLKYQTRPRARRFASGEEGRHIGPGRSSNLGIAFRAIPAKLGRAPTAVRWRRRGSRLKTSRQGGCATIGIGVGLVASPHRQEGPYKGRRIARSCSPQAPMISREVGTTAAPPARPIYHPALDAFGITIIARSPGQGHVRGMAAIIGIPRLGVRWPHARQPLRLYSVDWWCARGVTSTSVALPPPRDANMAPFPSFGRLWLARHYYGLC
jgi:hypothetical protein